MAQLGKQLHLLMECTAIYDDIDEYIKKVMKDNGDLFKKAADNNGINEYGINMYFVLSTYRVLIELKGTYQLDLRDRFQKTDWL